MSKRRELELAQPNEYLGRTLHRVYAALYNNVPWLAVIAVCLYLPGIVLWAVFALHCKADTFLFLTTIAPVAPETVDGVSNLVNTTLIALITTATCLFMLALVLAIARSVQKAGAAPNSSFPCVRNSPSSYYLYRVFNLGYNFIVFFVNMFIVFLMMGAFLWLVVAYGANLSIKGGVLDAATNGFRPLQQYNLAKQNYTTVVSYYEQQVKNTPPCVRNTTWFKGINSSIASILKPLPGNDSSPGNTVLCPQSCLNLGSWATLFKLQSNCICEQQKLYQLQQHSLAVATDAGVALGGLILIYFGSCCMHAYLISERVHAGYDYRKAKRVASRRQQLGPSSSSNDNPRGGTDKGPHNGGSGAGGGRGDGDPYGFPGPSGRDGAAHHVIAMNGSGFPQDPGPDGFDRSTSTVMQGSSHGQPGHVHHRSSSSNSAHESMARGAAGESRGGSFSAVEDARVLQQGAGADTGLIGNGHMGEAAGAAAGMLAATALAAAAASAGTGSFSEISPFVVAAEGSLHHQQQQGVLQGGDGFLHHPQHRLHRHHRASSGGGSSSSPSAASRQLQRVPSPLNAGRSAAAAAAAAAAAGLSAHSSAGTPGVGGVYLNDSVHGHRGSGSRVTDWQQQQQQHHDHVRAASPPASMVAAWSAHGRSESRSSTSSIRDLLSGAIPLDQFGHVPRMGLTPTSSGNAAAAVAAMQQQQLQQQQPRVPVIQEVPGSITAPAAAAGAGAGAAAAAALPTASSGSSGGPQKRTHRRGDSQQSNSSSSSYGTVVCHSPRSSEPDNSSSVAQSVLQASSAAAPGAFLAGCVMGRAPAGVGGTPPAVQKQAAAAVGRDTEVPAAPIAVGAAVDGEEALSGSRTGSWSKKQAHRRLPALDFTTAAPALWLAKDGETQQQQQQQPAAGPRPQQQQQQQLLESSKGRAASLSQQERAQADRAAALAGVAAAGAAALAAGAAVAVASGGGAAAAAGDGGAATAAAAAIDGQCEQRLMQQDDASAHPQQQTPAGRLQQQQQAAGSEDAQQQQQQQQQHQGQIPSMAAVAAMLQPSPEPNKQEQQQQQQQELQQGLRDLATFEAEQQQQQQQQQQRTRQRPPYSLLLLPPEQHELMQKQQQQQLQVLLQQAQEEQQQHAWTPHHRQWSTSSLSLAASNSSTGSPSSAYMRQQQQQQLQQQQHHHSFSTPNVAAAAAAGYGSGVSPQGLGGVGGGYGAAAAAGPRASYGSVQRPLAPSLASLGGLSQQQQQGELLPGSFGSSSGGGVRFAGAPSANGDNDSSPGDGTSSVASRSFAALHTPRSLAAGGTAAGASGSTAGGSVASSLYNTPQATPHSSPAPLRSLSGRMTPAGTSHSGGAGLYGLGNSAIGSSSGAAGAGGSSSSWGQMPQGSMLTTSSSYSGSANAPGYGGGLNNLMVSSASQGTPRSVLSPLGREEVLPLQGSVSGYGLLNPGGVAGSSGVQGSGVLAIPPIPEVIPGEGLEIEPVGGPLGANGAAATGAGDAGAQQQQQDVVMESPLERRRSGYRSSMRKGLMVYDQYKHRQRYQDALTQPLDPGSELARRYRSRMPAI